MACFCEHALTAGARPNARPGRGALLGAAFAFDPSPCDQLFFPREARGTPRPRGGCGAPTRGCPPAAVQATPRRAPAPLLCPSESDANDPKTPTAAASVSALTLGYGLLPHAPRRPRARRGGLPSRQCNPDGTSNTTHAFVACRRLCRTSVTPQGACVCGVALRTAADVVMLARGDKRLRALLGSQGRRQGRWRRAGARGRPAAGVEG